MISLMALVFCTLMLILTLDDHFVPIWFRVIQIGCIIINIPGVIVWVSELIK